MLTQPIVLNPNIKYEIQLANIHASSFEKMLVAGDYGESYISYNISLFNYDKDSQSYKVNDRFTRELFRLAPSKDVEGLFEYGTGNIDFNKTIPNDNGANDVITGKPSQRYQKDEFIKKLSSSMEIKKELNSAFFEKNAILGLLKKNLTRGGGAEIYNKKFRGNNNLLARWFSEANSMLFADFYHLDVIQMFKLISKLMVYAKYTNSEYRYLIKVTSQLDRVNMIPNKPSTRTEPLSTAKMSVAFVKHLREMEKSCKVLQHTIKSRTDEALLDMFRGGYFDRQNAGGKIIRVCKKSDIDDKFSISPENRKSDNSHVNSNEILSHAEENSIPPTTESIHDLLSRAIYGANDIVVGSANEFGGVVVSNEIDNDTNKTTVDVNSGVDTPNTVFVHPNSEKVSDISNKTQTNKSGPLIGIFIKLGNRMSKFLGVGPDQIIMVGHHGFADFEKTQSHYVRLTPNFAKPRVNTLMVYSDVVNPTTRVGGVQTSILDMITVPETGMIHRSNARPLYRPLKNHTIHTISTSIHDCDGSLIQYPRDVYTALELVIRPVRDNV